jgi:hypothetical protein
MTSEEGDFLVSDFLNTAVTIDLAESHDRRVPTPAATTTRVASCHAAAHDHHVLSHAPPVATRGHSPP